MEKSNLFRKFVELESLEKTKEQILNEKKLEQIQLKEIIKKDMEDIGYKLLPPFDDIEVLDVTQMDGDKRNAYYQNLSKLAIEKEFDKWMADFDTNIKKINNGKK